MVLALALSRANGKKICCLVQLRSTDRERPCRYSVVERRSITTHAQAPDDLSVGAMKRCWRNAVLPLINHLIRTPSLYCARMYSPDSTHLLFSTCPDEASAEDIARVLVGEGLAACVTRFPGARSIYRWQGGVEQAEEVQLLIKTSGDRLAAALTRLHALHPYELPEAVAVQVSAGLPAYLQWVHTQTREET